MLKMRFELLVLAAIFFISCSNSYNNVGDIAFDPATDNSDFKVCNENRILQYYNFGKGLMYHGEKFEILEHLNQHFKASEAPEINGYLTVRFIVNCNGETGRFRTSEMDLNYQEIQFDQDLKGQLLELTKELNKWQIGKREDSSFDYYQYLTYKIEGGQLTDIMP